VGIFAVPAGAVMSLRSLRPILHRPPLTGWASAPPRPSERANARRKHAGDSLSRPGDLRSGAAATPVDADADASGRPSLVSSQGRWAKSNQSRMDKDERCPPFSHEPNNI